MARTNLLYSRGTKYYFRRRIPTDLVKAKAYGGDKEIRESLHTSDKREAERLAHFRAIELLDEWERKRSELRAKGVAGFVRRSNGVSTMRPLSSLTPLERRAFIHGLFIRLEKTALAGGVRDPGSLPERAVTDLIENTKTDLAVMTGHSNYAPLDWDEKLTKALAEQEIEVDRKGEAVLPELRELITRAYVESAERTLRSLKGEWQPREDSLFRDIGIESSLPEVPKSISLEKLGIAYERHQKEVGSSLGTLAKLPQRINIMTSLWGAKTPVSSMGREHATQLVNFLRKLPKNASKHYPANMPLLRMSELEAKKDSPVWVSPKTQHDHFGSISAILNYAVDEGWLASNPLSSRSVVRRLPDVEHQAKPMMTPDDLTLVIPLAESASRRHQS